MKRGSGEILLYTFLLMHSVLSQAYLRHAWKTGFFGLQKDTNIHIVQKTNIVKATERPVL